MPRTQKDANKVKQDEQLHYAAIIQEARYTYSTLLEWDDSNWSGEDDDEDEDQDDIFEVQKRKVKSNTTGVAANGEFVDVKEVQLLCLQVMKKCMLKFLE